MPHRPRKKKASPKEGELGFHQVRANQFLERQQRDMATRSTLSRLRNRKSDLK